MSPRLARSVPFWAIAIVSVASIGFGLWLVLSKTGEMSAKLADQSAGYEQVYVNPTWVGFGGILVGAGVVGLVVLLALAALSSLLPQPMEEVIFEEIVTEIEPVVIDEPAPAEAVVATEAPVEEAPAAEEAPATEAAAPKQPVRRTPTPAATEPAPEA